METFESKITDISTYYDPEGVDEIYGTVIVRWCYEMEMRSWGLKGASIFISELEGSLFYQDENGERDDDEIDIQTLDFEFQTEGLEDKKLTDDVCASKIEINYKDKTITVIF